MNERIRDLAIQAKLVRTAYNGFKQGKLTPEQEKFAELIVKECFSKLEPYLDDQFIDDIESEIKEHFGVEKC